jgi:biotin carboxyl carrier protein
MTQELTIHTEKETSHQVQFENDELTSGLLNGNSFDWDVVAINATTFHIIKDNKSYRVELLEKDSSTKSYVIKVNGKKIPLKIADQFDKLLHQLGMDDLNSAKVDELKAPMPGLVLKTNVEVGQKVAAGDALMVLEAMKMENVLKSPTDGIIKSIDAEIGKAVEKNQVLITFE